MGAFRIPKHLAVALVLAALLAPLPFTKATWADDWADETAPTDNPRTPGPDLYPNKRIEDGVVSMPDLVPGAPALSLADASPAESVSIAAEPARPASPAEVRNLSGAPRAPPAASA